MHVKRVNFSLILISNPTYSEGIVARQWESLEKGVTDGRGRLLYFLKQGYKLDLPINFMKWTLINNT